MKTLDAIDTFLFNCKARNLKPRTNRYYKDTLTRFANDWPELPTEPEPIEHFLSSIDHTPETKHAYYRALRALYNFIEKRQHLPNPMKEVSAPQCPRKIMPTLEIDDVVCLINLPKNPRDQALLILFIDTGIRAGEAASLRRCDIGSETIVVRGKSGERRLPVSVEAREQLLELSQGRSPQDHVFIGIKGPLTANGIYQIMQSYMRQAGIPGPKLGPHRLRHSFGRAWIMAGGDIRSLQQIMGHASVTTTEQYVSLAQGDLIDKHRQYSPLSRVIAGSVVQEAEEIVKEAKCQK